MNINNNFNYNNIYFKSLNEPDKDKSQSEPKKTDDDSLKSASDALTSYGKSQVTRTKTPYQLFLERLDKATDSEPISIEDAVQEINELGDYSSKTKTDMILACTYEDTSNEPEINKKALLSLKNHIYNFGQVPKLIDAVRTCLDEDKKEFNSSKFENLFNYNGKLKLSARLKSRSQNEKKGLRNPKAERRLKILCAVEGAAVQTQDRTVELTSSDLFTPLKTINEDLCKDLAEIKDMPDELRTNMQTAINNNNYDLKKVHQDYYSLLNDCKTTEGVEEFYPELKFPQKPTKDPNGTSTTLRNRLANEDFDKIVIDILKKSYIDLKSKEDIYVPLENSRSTSYTSLKKAGFEFSYPSKDVLQLIKKSNKVYSTYANMPKMDEEEIQQTAKKQAKRKSKIWTDFHEMTAREWRPVRLIENKRLKPQNSNYSTPKLVNTYLYHLYKQDPNKEYSANPLEKYGEQTKLTPPTKAIINKIYFDRYKGVDNVNKDAGFNDFAQKFDKEAIGKSIEAMETNYTKAFYRKYWTPERLNSLKSELQTATDLIYEKIFLNEEISPKVISDKDVKALIDSDLSEEPEKETVNEALVSRLKTLTSKIQDHDLRKRCQDCISNPQDIDIDYFNSVYKMVEESTDADNNVDEDKANVLFHLHDKYLNQLLSTDGTQSEEDFISAQTEPFRSESGEVDYHNMKKEIEAESEYYSKTEKHENNGYGEFVNLVNDKFVLNDSNYVTANHVLDLFDSIPDDFKDKFTSTFRNKTKINPKILVRDLDSLHKTITGWNYDNYDVFILDGDKIPQGVVITHDAKKDLFNMVGGNFETFDSYYKKICMSAQHRTGKKNGQGVKVLTHEKGLDAEIKILGHGGGIRVFAETIPDEEKQKYSTDDLNIKYVFNHCDDHL